MSNNNIGFPDFRVAPAAKTKSPAAWLWFFIRPYRYSLALCFAGVLLVQALFRLDAFFFAMIIHAFESGQAAAQPWRVWLWVGLFMGVNALAIIVLYFGVAQRGSKIMDIISKIATLHGFSHYLDLSESWHEDRASGEKLQSLLAGRSGIFELLQSAFWSMVPLLATLTAIVFSILALDVPLYFIGLFLGLVCTYLFLAAVTSMGVKPYLEEYYKSLENVVGGVYEFVTSTATLRLFNLRAHALRMGQQLEAHNHESRVKMFRATFRRWFALDTAALLWISLILGLAVTQTLSGALSLAALTIIMFLCASLWSELVAFAFSMGQVVEHWESFKRLTQMLNNLPAITERPAAKTLSAQNADITFENVSFGYRTDQHVITDVTLHIKAGEKIGLIGPSGAGKSTIVKLLMRFYDVESGAINIGGQDIRDVTLESLQESIAVIPQDITLFNHPLIENIRYGFLSARDEDVIEAAKRAEADAFIRALPSGYQTLVGERGVKLSGGQRQRIAIARAILKNAPILVLDEATSALDSESEILIQQSLNELMHGKTVIAIAHRLSTIARLDRLIVMDKGSIAETGTHTELLARGGLYARLWAMQSGGFLQEAA